MTSDAPPSSGGMPPGDNRRRKAPTIDLEATEIEGTAAQAAAADQAKSAAPGRTLWLSANIPWPAIVAGAAGGAIIAQLFLVASLFIARDGDVSGLDARLARVEGELRDGPSRPPPAGTDRKTLDELASRLAKLEAAVATVRPTSDAASANRLSTIEGDLKALTEAVGILGRRSDEVTTAAREARQRADSTAAALAELTQRSTPPAADVAARDKIEGELQKLTNRLAAVEGAEKAIETDLAKRAESRDRPGRFAVAATALNVAVERGQPFTAELAAVKSLAADPKLSAPLEPFAASGVPTTAALARELSALMPSLLAAAGTPPRDGSFLEKLQANAEKLVRVRPLDAAAGRDPAAIVARIEINASKGDLAGALAELADLPPAARAPAGAWIDKAQGRSAAVEASRRLAADALAGLSK
jgi:inner membrane protein